MALVEPWQLVVSVDDHVIEPPDTWLSRLPSKYHGTCPQVVRDERGEAWVYDGRRIEIGGMLVMGGIDEADYDPSPVRYADMRAACYDAKERVAAMDRDGVLASMAFPTVPRFCGQEFAEARDHELGFLCVQAYNDFLLDEWAAVAPERMIPLIIIPLWDPRLAAQEIERCAAKGAKSIAFSELPPALGLPSIHDPDGYWDPVFAAASDTGLPLSIHVGSSSQLPSTGPDAPRIIPSILISWVAATTCVDWLFCHALARYPGLRVTLSEGGIGWVPMTLAQTARQIRHNAYMDRFEVKGSLIEGSLRTDRRDEAVPLWPHGDKDPWQVFRERIRGCFIGEAHAGCREAIDAIGTDVFLAEVDFPHSDSSYPRTVQECDQLLDGLPVEDQRRLRQTNAIEWYDLDRSALDRIAQELTAA